jgi:hypothetical protein
VVVPCAARIANLGAALASVAVVACFSPSPPRGIPCSSSRDCPSGQVCDAVTSVCDLPTEPFTWRDDTAEDFGADGASTDEVTVEAAGFVGPAAYLVGGLRFTGIDRNAIPNVGSTTWDQLAAATHSGASLARGFFHDFLDRVPPGLGFSGGDNITIMFEGEVDLDAAGMWRFELTANDLGFLEIAKPGTSTFQRVVTDTNTGSVGNFDVATPGWHRVRGAFADRAMNMSLDLRYDPPNVGGNFRRIPADRMRARGGDLTGVLVDGFEEAFFVGARGSVRSAGTFGGPALASDPFGLPIGNLTFSLRFASQVLIDIDGSYSFRIDSHHGHRAWLDGASIADVFDSVPRVSTTAPVRLAPGWHDLVVDVHRNGGTTDGRLAVTVADGPMWAGQPIPADHLRPIVGRGTRWTGGTSGTVLAIPDGMAATRTITLDLPPGFTTTRIDAGLEVDHPVLASLDLVLDPPVGANVSFAAAGSLMGSGSHSEHAQVSPGTSGATWNFIATDTAADMMTGNITFAAVTLIGPGGIAPFPTRYRYTSAPRELGDVASYGAVHWGLRQTRADTTVSVSMRTCDDAAACEAEPFVAITEGMPPNLPPRRFAQYTVELTGNGDVPTALDWIAIDYTAHVEK